MIPTIGVMIGAYIFVRCMEIAAMPDAHFTNRASAGGVRVTACLVAVLAAFSLFSLVSSGVSVLDLAK